MTGDAPGTEGQNQTTPSALGRQVSIGGSPLPVVIARRQVDMHDFLRDVRHRVAITPPLDLPPDSAQEDEPSELCNVLSDLRASPPFRFFRTQPCEGVPEGLCP